MILLKGTNHKNKVLCFGIGKFTKYVNMNRTNCVKKSLKASNNYKGESRKGVNVNRFKNIYTLYHDSTSIEVFLSFYFNFAKYQSDFNFYNNKCTFYLKHLNKMI